MAGDRGVFDHLFQRAARRIRTRLAARWALSGVSVGLCFGAGFAALTWWFHQPSTRPYAAALGLAGGLLALALALRRRWSDRDVALYLDARLGGREAITTALDLSRIEQQPARAKVLRAAGELLSGVQSVGPRVARRFHALIPVGGALLVGVCLLPVRPSPAAPTRPPGAELVQKDSLAGLEPLVRLDRLPARDPAQKARLDAIAQKARALQQELVRGMERREALSEIAKLRDATLAERLQFTDAETRRGLEAAVQEMSKERSLLGAARALGDGDLTAFDERMRELAARTEDAARESAREALERAKERAGAEGADALERVLEEQERLLAERAARSEALRELAEAMRDKLNEEALSDLEEFGATGSNAAAERLSRALADALEKLEPDERKRLAERLSKALSQNSDRARPLSPEELDELAEELAKEGAEKRLLEALKELARDPSSAEAERQRGLGEAERGGAEAQRELGGVLPAPIGEPGTGPRSPGEQGGSKPEQGGSKPGLGGPSEGGGAADHDGATPELAERGLRAKASPPLIPGAPMHAASLGRSPARGGETARELGSGALGRVAPSEIGAAERSDIPEEYRDQVGRYFQP